MAMENLIAGQSHGDPVKIRIAIPVTEIRHQHPTAHQPIVIPVIQKRLPAAT